MGTAHQLQQSPPSARVFIDEYFVKQLAAFNAMTRALREAGIEILSLMQHDNRIYIRTEDSDLVKSNFLSEIRGMRYRTTDRVTHNVVTIRGVDVAWLTPVKEQDR